MTCKNCTREIPQKHSANRGGASGSHQTKKLLTCTKKIIDTVMQKTRWKYFLHNFKQEYCTEC